MTIWTTQARRDHYAILRNGVEVGSMTKAKSGYVDWSFSANRPRPSAATQRRLLSEIGCFPAIDWPKVASNSGEQ
jgi:hypothetical protein